MEKNFVKCSDCWRNRVSAVKGYNKDAEGMHHFDCNEVFFWAETGSAGCTKGVTTSMIIEAITEECDRNKEEANACADRHEALENAFYSLKKQRNYLQQKENIIHPHRANRREKYIWTSNPWTKLGGGMQHGKTAWVNFMFPPSIDETHKACKRAAEHCVHDTARSIPNGNPPAMATFCCENCQEPVIVPKDMLKDELTFKCMSCYQVNHYDLS